jgi:mannosyltransferase
MKINSYSPWLQISLLVLFVTTLSFVFFQHQSLRLDEAQSLWQTSRSVPKIIEIIGEDVHVPFYHLVLHSWQFLFGNGVETARILSLVFFILSIPAFYALGKRLYNHSIAMFATIIFTISPFMNWYGNEIRMYSLFVLLAILNAYFYVGIYKDKDGASWWGFAATALLGIYTHYFFFLILLTDAIFYFFNREQFEKKALRKFILVACGLAVAFIPWALNVYLQGSASNTQPGLQLPTSINLFNTLSQFIFGFQTDHLNTILVSLWPLTVLVGFFALRKHSDISSDTIYLVLAFLLPNIFAFTLSFVFNPVYVTRYLIFTLPPMYLLLSWLISRYPSPIDRFARFIIIFAMILTLVSEVVSAATPVKENYREAAMYLEENADSSDVIVVSAPFTIYPMLYYYRGSSAVVTLPLWDQGASGPIPPYDESKLPADLEKIKGNRQDMWLLLSYDQGYEEKLRIYMDTHFERLSHTEFSHGMNLYQYKLRYDTDTATSTP